MTQHTPGPWVVKEWPLQDREVWWEIRAPRHDKSGSDAIAEVYEPENARLIAAAPRMLEIIRALVSSPAMVDNDEPMMQDARAILRELENTNG